MSVNDIGDWFAIVYHGMTSPTTNIMPFQLTVTPIKTTNVFLDGFYFNRTLTNYIKNCYADEFSTNANAPWDLSQCLC